jgi:formylglycine-generating enzyme required for sulfatase activity
MKEFILILLLLWTGPAGWAQSRGLKPVEGDAPVGTERRIALVVGNRDYLKMNVLRNPLNDASDMAQALQKLGFEVITVTNADYRALTGAVNRFKGQLSRSDVALFYYSGHGLSYGGKNYLMPVDADISCLDQIEEYGVSLNRILGDISAQNVRNSFVFLDACRNVPDLKVCNATQRDVSLSAGLAKPTNNPRGSMVVYATEEGSTADDNVEERNGLFTGALLRYLTTPDQGIRTILDQTSIEVEKKSLGRQVPGRYDKLLGDFVFVQSAGTSRSVPTSQPQEKPTVTENKTTGRTYLDLPFAELVRIEGGTFSMGDNRGEGEEIEKPVHPVTVRSFWMGKYEVTQRQWEEIMGNNPSFFKDCDDCPVEQVSWDNVQMFLQKLNTRSGARYRLPTEAEWEYAAGGGNGTRTRFGNGRDEANPAEINFEGRANYKKTYSVVGEFRGKTVPVGSLLPNQLGLHDMSGNVYEWCSDWYGPYATDAQTDPPGPATGTERVFRGGSWDDFPQNIRITRRSANIPSFRYSRIGFRLVLDDL